MPLKTCSQILGALKLIPSPGYETDQRDIFHEHPTSTTISQTQWGGEWPTSFYPPMSEAWISGYNVGRGVAAQAYCWGCKSFGVIVPSTALVQ